MVRADGVDTQSFFGLLSVMTVCFTSHSETRPAQHAGQWKMGDNCPKHSSYLKDLWWSSESSGQPLSPVVTSTVHGALSYACSPSCTRPRETSQENGSYFSFSLLQSLINLKGIVIPLFKIKIMFILSWTFRVLKLSLLIVNIKGRITKLFWKSIKYVLKKDEIASPS